MGADAMDQFCRWLVEDDDHRAPGRAKDTIPLDSEAGTVMTTCFCHNLKGFDGFPLLRWLYSENILPDVIMTGRKIMCIKVPAINLKFVDSLSFLPMPLKAIPKAMGLPTEVSKGDFPHRLNRMENMGKPPFTHHPPLSYYDPDARSDVDRQSLEQWHAEVRRLPFDFDQQLRDYCKNDVAVLLQGVLAFRDQFMAMTVKKECAPDGVDPFADNVTIAGACNRVFRMLFLQPDLVGLIPSEGYLPEHNQSTEAIRWLTYMALSSQGRIEHARNGGEKTLEGIGKVDGYREDPTDGSKWVYEFHVSQKNSHCFGS